MAGQTFSTPSDSERAWIARQLEGARLFVAAMSPGDAGFPDTLDALDRAWAAWLPQAGDDNDQVNAAINAVGMQFGQHLVDHLGFTWTIATDAHGTDLAVLALPGRGDVLVYPANFVAKRWERGETGFLTASFEAIREQVSAVAGGRSAGPRPWWRFW